MDTISRNPGDTEEAVNVQHNFNNIRQFKRVKPRSEFMGKTRNLVKDLEMIGEEESKCKESKKMIKEMTNRRNPKDAPNSQPIREYKHLNKELHIVEEHICDFIYANN